MTKVCYDINVREIDPSNPLSGRGCFEAEGSPQLLPSGTGPDQLMHNVDTRSNGKYDMVLRDAAGKLYHLTAPSYELSSAVRSGISADEIIVQGDARQSIFNFVFLSGIYKLKTGKDVEIKIGDKKYKVIQTDDANADRSRAAEDLSDEFHQARCSKKIERVRTPNTPKPRSITTQSVSDYCFAQIQQTYDIDRISASAIIFSFREVLIQRNVASLETYMMGMCANLPQTLPFEIDRCQ